MLPLRLVIDTNVLISAAIKPAGLQRTVLLLAITKPARLYISTPILEEYSEVLARPELQIRKGLRQQLLNSTRTIVIRWLQHGAWKSHPIPMTICSWNVPMSPGRIIW